MLAGKQHRASVAERGADEKISVIDHKADGAGPFSGLGEQADGFGACLGEVQARPWQCATVAGGSARAEA